MARPDVARPADLPRAHPVHDAGGVVHLGHQHAVPARRRARQHPGVRGERVLHRRAGPVRGPDRRRRRHAGPAVLVPARRRRRCSSRRCCTWSCGRSSAGCWAGRSPRSCSGSASRSSPARPRRGWSTRSRRPASPATLESVFARAQIVTGVGDARPARSLGGVVAQATNLGVPYLLRAAMLGVTFVDRLPVHARHRASPRAAARRRRRDRRGARRLGRRRSAQPAGALADARRAVHGRASASTRSTRSSRTCCSCTATRTRTASPASRRRSSPARRSSAG